MKTTLEKSPLTTSPAAKQPASQPFFAQAGRGGFFEPVIQRSTPAVQMKMTVNKPGDKFEQEADTMAEKVMRMPAPALGEEKRQIGEIPRKEREEEKIRKVSLPEEKIQKAEAKDGKLQNKEEEKIQRKSSDGVPAVGADTQSAIRNRTTGGQPISHDVRGYMEPRFGADFSNVRVHSDPESASLNNQLSARAFTYQNHIFFSRDQYQPGTGEGKQLLAHELTHTIQQGQAIQRSPQVSTTITPPPIQRLGTEDALGYFANAAYAIPGFRLLTIVIGYNPINRQGTDRNASNLLRALIELMPGGFLVGTVLENYGLFNKAGAWVEQKIAAFTNIGAGITAGLTSFISSLNPLDLVNPGGIWERAKRIFTDPIGQLISFAGGVAGDLLHLVKTAILKPLAALAEGTAGYDLLKALLGEDPITGEVVPRNADTLLGGFMKLIGQQEIWQNLKKGNAVPRAWAWFQGALAGLLGFARSIPQRVMSTVASLSFQDVVSIAGAFSRIVTNFAGIAGEFLSWGLNQVISLLEILFSVVAPGVIPYIKKAQGAFQTILRNPIGFVGNLVQAGKLGFIRFANGIAGHLMQGLIKWLTGPMAAAGIYVLKSFTLPEVLKMVASALGLTWANIRKKLLKIIPEPVLVGLEKTAGILVTFVQQGPAAALEQIKAELTELKDQLISQIIEMVTSQVVQAAVTKLVSLFNPAGAIIQAIIAIYNTISVFINQLGQIAAVAAAFIDSIAAIAAGQLEGAAKKVERTLAGTLPIVIAFFAKLAGAGSIPDKLFGLVMKGQKFVDKGIEKVVAWLGGLLKKLGDKLFGKKDDKRTKEEKEQALAKAVQETQSLKDSPPKFNLKTALFKIKEKYKLADLSAVQNGNAFTIHAAVNPEVTFELSINAKNVDNIIKTISTRISTLKTNINSDDSKKDIQNKRINLYRLAHDLVKGAVEEAELIPVYKKIAKGEEVFVKSPSSKIEYIGRIIMPDIIEETTKSGTQGIHNFQEIYTNIESKQQYVRGSGSTLVQRYIQRFLSEKDYDDNSKNLRTSAYEKVELKPRDKNAPIRIAKHVINAKLKSPLVSGTTYMGPEMANRVTGEPFNNYGRVKIDLANIDPKNIYDLSTVEGQENLYSKSKDANTEGLADIKHTQEVLMNKGVPKGGVISFIPK